MTSETDAAFLDRLEATPRYNPAYRTLDSDRLFALARRGAEAAAEIERLRADLAHADAKGQENDKLLWGTIKDNERLRAALREIDHARYTRRNTINPDSSYEHAIALNEKFIAVMDIARAALAPSSANFSK
jgi:hypothetical protein